MKNEVQAGKPFNTNELEAKMLQCPQVECPITHHFGPGLYIREVLMPAGSLIVGHSHKHDNMNIMLTGKLKLLCENGEVKELSAPHTFVNGPGRKVAYIIEDVVWQNVYPTDETDIEKLEDMYIEKSEAWLLNNERISLLEQSLIIEKGDI